MARTIVSCIAWVACLTVTAAPPEPEPLPSAAELHQMFKSEQYQPLLQKLSRVLSLHGNLAAGYDRVDLLILKGNTLLQLKQQSSALDAFVAAQKEGRGFPAMEKPVAWARASELLTRRSRALAYQPKPTPASPQPAPISLLDMSQRKAAFEAMLAEEQQLLAPKVTAAVQGSSLGPIIDVTRDVLDCRSLELAAKDSDDVTRGQLDALVDRTTTLTTDALRDMGKNHEQVHASANTEIVMRGANGQVIYFANTNIPIVRRQGLTRADTTALKDIMDTCDKIAGVCRDYATLCKDGETKFGPIFRNAQELFGKAKLTLNDDYTKSVNNLTRTTR